jgi:hypothetical protein
MLRKTVLRSFRSYMLKTIREKIKYVKVVNMTTTYEGKFSLLIINPLLLMRVYCLSDNSSLVTIFNI